MTKIISRLFFVMICVAGAVSAEQAPHSQRVAVSVPGTGVRLTLPLGISAMPLGTYFTDASGETVIQLFGGSGLSNLENNSTYIRLFPDTPEKFSGAHVTGNLYKRTRAKHGGAWDGWWLNVVRGDAVLSVQIMYIGQPGERFERLKALFYDLEWNEREVVTELAFGASISVPKLRLVTGSFGGLNYTENGQAKSSGSELRVMTLPVNASQAKILMPAGCAQSFAAVFKNEPYSGPHYLERNGISFCDAWKPERNGRSRYLALLRMPNGAVLNAIGSGDVDQFRAALLDIRLTRTPSTRTSK